MTTRRSWPALLNSSLTRKLGSSIAAACVFALVVVTLAVVLYEVTTFRPRTLRTLNSHAELLSGNLHASINFQDTKAARRILHVLKSVTSMRAAAVFLPDGNVFADFVREGEKNYRVPPLPSATQFYSTHDRVLFVHPIVYEGEMLGHLFFDYELPPLFLRMPEYSFLVGFVGLAIATMALILAISLRKDVVKPVLALAETAHKVRESKDYGMRVQERGDDEIGRLATAFNDMLATIDEHSEALRNERRTLAGKVRDLNLLFDISDILNINTPEPAEVCAQVVELLRKTFNGNQDTCARIRLSGAEYRSSGFFESHLALSCPIGPAGIYGQIDLHRQSRTETPPVQFTGEDKRLLDNIAQRLSEFVERRTAEAESKALQEKLLHVQKLETLGTLAGGIAHDFNNILTPIIGNLDMALQEEENTKRLRACIQHALEGADRAASLVRQILTFGGKTHQQFGPVRLQDVVDEALKLVRPSLPATIAITTVLDTACSPVLADASQLHQVIMNLVANASHAMKENGGLLRIALDVFTADSEFCSANVGFSPRRYARLTVSDTGRGMDDETRRRLFEPFFTTKPPGEGTGLGLSVVHGIVTGCRGVVTFKTDPGKGTDFYVHLPLIEDATTAAQTDERRDSSYQSLLGHERVLYIDDEPAILSTVRQMFTAYGYTVTVIERPADAIELFGRDPTAFDVVVTDQTMPHMTGLVLAKRILEIRQDIPVILTTGFSESITNESLAEHGVRLCLYKPFRPTDLIKTVRQEVDRPPD